MANYLGVQTLNGLQTTTLFTAPSAGVYFVQGSLTLPWSTPEGSSTATAVVATVKQNGSGIYTGIAGASGFAVNQIVCASGDVIAVTLSSGASPDLITNAVKGVVSYGNTF